MIPICSAGGPRTRHRPGVNPCYRHDFEGYFKDFQFCLTTEISAGREPIFCCQSLSLNDRAVLIQLIAEIIPARIGSRPVLHVYHHGRGDMIKPEETFTSGTLACHPVMTAAPRYRHHHRLTRRVHHQPNKHPAPVRLRLNGRLLYAGNSNSSNGRQETGEADRTRRACSVGRQAARLMREDAPVRIISTKRIKRGAARFSNR